MSIAMLVMAFLLLLAAGAGAESIDVSREAELSVSYAVEGKPIADVAFSLYRVADVDAGGSFSLAGQFSGVPVSLSGLNSEGMRNLAQTLSGYVAVNGYSPDATGKTDSQGRLRFGRVPTGLYLVTGETVVRGGIFYNPGATMVCLPTLEDDGDYNYVVTMKAKQDFYPLTRVRVQKRWVDGGARDSRPDGITVSLLRDGEVYDSQELTAEGDWQYEWTGLNANSVWNVVEDPQPENYDVTVSVDGDEFIVTNRFRPQPTPLPRMELAGEKQWIDEENAKLVRPESIEITLYANGTATEAVPEWGDTSGSTWAFTFRDLPAVDEAGQPIAYTVSEVPVPYYETSVEGMVIVNRLIPQPPSGYLSIAGTKSWVGDEPDQRPDSVTVELLQNGVVIDQRTVSAADGWAYDFGELPADDGYGHTYTYEISEQMVSGYYAQTSGFDLVNVRIPTRERGTPPEPRTPPFEEFPEEELEELIDIFDYDVPLWGGLLKTGAETPLYPFVFGGIGALALIILLVFGRKKKKGKE